MKFKQTEIGCIPEHWKVLPIRDVTMAVTDYVANGSFASLAANVSYKDDKDVAVLIRLVDYNNNFQGNFVYIDDHAYNFLSKSKLYGGEIIISNVGANVGTVFRCPTLPYKMSLAPNSIMVKFNENNDFYFHWLKSRNGQQMIKSIVTGSAQPKFNKTNFRQMLVPVPPIEEQNRIAAILNAIDDKINKNRQINDNLQQQAQAIYHERFETVSPNDLPSDWRIVTLGEVATISNKSFNPLKEPEILLEHYSIPAFDEARFPVFELSTSIKSNKFIIDASCFMISKLNPTTKRVWKPYCLTGNAVCSTEFIVYKAKDNTITDFLYSVIDSNSFSDFMCSHVTGSTGSRQRTTPSDTLAYELILPSEDELAEFQSLVSPMYAQIRINAIENDRLKRLRDSLLPKLMSGEIDVSDIQL